MTTTAKRRPVTPQELATQAQHVPAAAEPRVRQAAVPQKAFRCEDDLWQSALAKAARRRAAGKRDENLSRVLRQALVDYVAQED